MTEKYLQWVVGPNNVPYQLYDLTHCVSVERGVYIIWSPLHRDFIDVGSGRIDQRLDDHRTQFASRHISAEDKDIWVTYAAVDRRNQEGVERYLAEELGLVGIPGKRFPDVKPIPVNLPDFFRLGQ